MATRTRRWRTIRIALPKLRNWLDVHLDMGKPAC
jgi:hypothetical protein